MSDLRECCLLRSRMQKNSPLHISQARVQVPRSPDRLRNEHFVTHVAQDDYAVSTGKVSGDIRGQVTGEGVLSLHERQDEERRRFLAEDVDGGLLA